MDYENIARKAVGEMNTTHLQHFLMVCSLAPDLYCPDYNPRQPLSKDSRLAQAASRYKVETAKVAGEVKMELSKRKGKPVAKNGKREKKK